MSQSVQSVTKYHKVSESSLNTHLEMVWVGGGGGWWKPILVYSSGPTFELELELESNLTSPDLNWPDLDLDLELDLEWDLELDNIFEPGSNVTISEFWSDYIRDL